MLGSDMPDPWMRFVVREQLEPTATGAFERLFDAIRSFFETVHALVAREHIRRVLLPPAARRSRARRD